MELLARKYGKTCLVFVDDTWNVDARWNQEFATTLRRRDLGVVWFGFMRADLIERDEETGVFAELIASGLTHICIGLERTDDAEIEGLQKHRIKASHYHELVTRLRRRYPSLFLQTTFLVGLRTDTPERLDRLLAEVDRLDPDYPAFHPLTPVPGTALWKEANENGWLEIRDFAQYDWMTPVMGTETMSREELELKLWEMNRKYMGVTRVLRGVLSRHTYRRRMYLWWLTVTLRVLVDFATDRVFPSRSVRGEGRDLRIHRAAEAGLVRFLIGPPDYAAGSPPCRLPGCHRSGRRRLACSQRSRPMTFGRARNSRPKMNRIRNQTSVDTNPTK